MQNWIMGIYVATVFFAAISSLVSFRMDFPFHLKLFSCLLVLTAFVELPAAILAYRKINNWWLYNLFMPVEFTVYAWYYLHIIKARIARRMLQSFLLLFPVFWFVLIFRPGLRGWIGPLSTVGAFFCVVFALMYYYQAITAKELVSLRTLPEFWVATGMLIFYISSIGFFGMLNYIIKDNKVAVELLTVYLIPDIVMYAFFGYAFKCGINNITRSSSP